MQRRIRRLVLLLLAVLATCGAGLRRDEFVCEEAHARLTDCCPGFTTHVAYCMYVAGGCEGKTVYPALTTDESDCIRKRSCDEIRRAGMCERAKALTTPVYDAGSGRAAVCP